MRDSSVHRSLSPPLYEPKFFQIFDHRFATYAGVPRERRFIRKAGTNPVDRSDPSSFVTPRYWIDDQVVKEEWPEGNRQWSLAMRDMTNPVTNARTAIFSIVPYAAFGHGAPLLVTRLHTGHEVARLMAVLCSFAYDYFLRQKLTGGHLTLFLLRQTPVVPVESFQVLPLGRNDPCFVV